MTPPDEIWGGCFAKLTYPDSDKVDWIGTLGCIPFLIENVISIAVALAGAVAVFFIIWGGVQYIRSGGDPKQAEGARHTITYAIIGLIVVIMAYFILSVVSALTGANCIKLLGFTNCTNNVSAPASSSGKPFCPINAENYGGVPSGECACSPDSYDNGTMCRAYCTPDAPNYGGAAAGSCDCPDTTEDTGNMCKTK